jgi:membrane dipeptidase
MSEQQRFDRLNVLDAHCDILILRESRGDPIDLADVDPIYHVDLPRLRAGGFGCLFTMVGDSDLHQSGVLIGAAHAMCQAHPADFRLCRTAAEVRAANDDGRIGIVLTIEGQKMFAGRIEHLHNWHRLGVRVASITHGGGGGHELQVDGSFFGPIGPAARERLRRGTRGLTDFARESLRHMAALGIAVDVAHANDPAFWEVIETAECPVCYTHGACYAVCPHSRALTDDMMKALAARGGVMGIAFYSHFIDPRRPSLERLCDHFLHALEVMGPEHVGIGTDFDGYNRDVPDVIEGPAAVGRLFAALAARGVDEPTLHAIARDNFLRILPAK